MAKKNKSEILPEIPKELEVEIFASGPRDESFPKLGHIELDFGREDLNGLKNKINQIIDHLNR